MNATVTVRIPEALRQFTGGKHELPVKGESISGLMLALESGGYPALVRHVCTHDGELRPFVNVYLGEHDVRTLDGIETSVKQGDIVTILPSVAGG